MTLARSVYLICDGDGCIAMTGQHDANDAREARLIAMRLGWRRAKGGRDLCASCVRDAAVKP